jgi:hypothetical protein
VQERRQVPEPERQRCVHVSDRLLRHLLREHGHLRREEPVHLRHMPERRVEPVRLQVLLPGRLHWTALRETCVNFKLNYYSHTYSSWLIFFRFLFSVELLGRWLSVPEWRSVRATSAGRLCLLVPAAILRLHMHQHGPVL